MSNVVYLAIQTGQRKREKETNYVMSDIRRENEIEEYQKLLLIKGELNCEQIVTIDLT